MRRVLENWASCMNESLGSLRACPSKYICLGQKKATGSCTALHQHVCDHVLPLPSPGELSAQRSGQMPPLHLLMVTEPSARYCCPPASENLQSPLPALGYLSRCIFFSLDQCHGVFCRILSFKYSPVHLQMHVHFSYLLKERLGLSSLSPRKIKFALLLIVDEIYFIFQRQSDYKTQTELE